MLKPKSEAWVGCAAQALRSAGSWTGRIHVHKLLFAVQVFDLAQPPFEFEIYQYGPYSRDIDASFSEMEMFGILEKEYPDPAYGPRYKVYGHPEKELATAEMNVVERVAQVLRDRNSSDLELIATCWWVELRENKSEAEAIIDRVHEIKPKYTRENIAAALKAAREMRVQLAGSAR